MRNVNIFIIRNMIFCRFATPRKNFHQQYYDSKQYTLSDAMRVFVLIKKETLKIKFYSMSRMQENKKKYQQNENSDKTHL